jgi:hypothetical protein
VLAAGAAVVSTASAASAHTVSGAGSTNFRTSLTSFTPAVGGLTLAVVENGSRLRLTNTTGTDVTVLGYSGEPYLRVGPGGVFTNLRSGATYLNETRAGTTPIPASADGRPADGERPPVWRRTSAGVTAIWHDHRTHWMSPARPPVVAAAPQERHPVFTWQISFRYGDRPLTARGDLVWIPGPSPAPWVALTAGLAALALGVSVGRRTFLPGLAALLGTLVAADIAHSAGIAADRAGGAGARWHGFITGNGIQLAVWAVGLGAVAALARRRVNGLWVAGMVGAILALADGLPDAGVWYRSSAPFAWSLATARTLTSVTVGLGLGLLAAVALALWRHDRPARADPAVPPAASREPATP